MGFWGTGLYDNDFAADVKGRFDELIREYRSEVEATEIIEEEFAKALSDEHERFLFYTALADTQWDWGRLIDRIKNEALRNLDVIDDSVLFSDPVCVKERREVLEKLIVKLNSEQPQKKRIVKRRVYRCKWENGDTFSLPIVTDKGKELGFSPGQILIRKVSQMKMYPDHVIPIVYFKLLKGDKEIITLDDYNSAEYVQTFSEKYSHRFFPLDFGDLAGDIARKSKREYKRDKYGRLPVYRSQIRMTNEKQIPGELRYVGNFSEAEPPENEFIVHYDLNNPSAFWKRADGWSLEEIVLDKYEGYNMGKFILKSDE